MVPQPPMTGCVTGDKKRDLLRVSPLTFRGSGTAPEVPFHVLPCALESGCSERPPRKRPARSDCDTGCLPGSGLFVMHSSKPPNQHACLSWCDGRSRQPSVPVDDRRQHRRSAHLLSGMTPASRRASAFGGHCRPRAPARASPPRRFHTGR